MKRAFITTLGTITLLWSITAAASTLSQIPFTSLGVTLPKATRWYTVHSDTIHKYLFYELGGAGSFSFNDNGTQRSVVIFVDPVWSRVVYGVEDDLLKAVGGYGSQLDQFAAPKGIAVGSNGNVFVADTGNDRVVAFYFLANGGPNTPLHTLQRAFVIDGGANFAHPEKVCWDDGGTPAGTTDDYVWILDQSHGRVAAYHVYNDGTQFYASPFVFLNLRAPSNGTLPVDLCAFTKGRSYSGLTEASSFSTEDLYVYDRGNDQFLIYTVHRDPGFITTAAQTFMVSVRRVPNPLAGVQYSALATDAWGNIYAIDPGGSRICKFDRNMALLDTYGHSGSGPMGSGEMLDPVSLSFHTDKQPGEAAQYRNKLLLTERWSDATGIQQLKTGVVVRDLATQVRAGQDSMDVTYFTTDHCRATVQVLNGAGTPVRTILNAIVQTPGPHNVVWEGKNDAGTVVPRCVTYTAKVSAVSLYANPESSVVSSAFYYKPRLLKAFAISSNVPGTKLTFDARDSVLVGNTYAAACSICTIHTVSVPPVQMLSGNRYCWESWTGGGNRVNPVMVQRDTTLQLTLTRGSPPDTFAANVTLPVELLECNSPYVFLGDAKTSVAGLTLYQNTTLRFKILGTPAQFKVRGPLSANGVHFETTDSTSNNNTGKWSGLVADTTGGVTGGGNISFTLRNCYIRNAEDAISTVNWWNTNFTPRLLRSLSVDSVNFTSNTHDIRVKYLPTAGSLLHLDAAWSYARSPVAVWGAWGGEPAVTVSITNSQFLGLPLASMVALTGGMTGQINNNWFRGAENNTTTLDLKAYSTTTGPIPSVTLTGNKFNCTATNNRYAITAPYAPTGTGISAYYNDWGVYDVASIDALVFDKANEPGDPSHNPPIPGRAEVFYNPFTTSGGGGGGGGGCPFVLSRSDTGFVVENTLLGASELGPNPSALIEDAYPLVHAVRDVEGHVTLRVAELETETDKLDYLGLVAAKPEDGISFGVSLSGTPVAYRETSDRLNALNWSGRTAPYVSPVAPGEAYSGDTGDSLDLSCEASSFPPLNWRRGIGIHLIPKPHSGRIPVPPLGVTIRVSPDVRGDRWVTLEPIIPRENWSVAIVPLDALGSATVKRVRVVWNTRHALGHLALVDAQDLAELRPLPLLSARHSAGRSLATQVLQRDGTCAMLRPGEYVDLVFDAKSAPDNAQLFLLARGRYESGTQAAVPAAYGASRNRPNPFNPETSFELQLPKASKVTVRIYDVSGKLVRTLVNGDLPAGVHVVRWDGSDDRRRTLASGVYFYQINAGEFSRRDRVVLLR